MVTYQNQFNWNTKERERGEERDLTLPKTETRTMHQSTKQ